jgi:Metalloenzyme superfamily
MKSFLTCIALFAVLPVAQPGELSQPLPVSSSGNLFIIAIDGFRWQEIFSGADASLVGNEKYTPDTATIKMMYWADDPAERRKKLMPFFWNVIASKGQLYGNRHYDNNVNTANLYRLSYPGYNEMLTGNTDIKIFSNSKTENDNINVLEYLNEKEGFKGKVVAFTSWDVFPYILNEKRNKMLVNSGYENMRGEFSAKQAMINSVQTDAVYQKEETRYDQLTFLTAKEYINQNKPRVVFLGLGETDEFAHDGRYDLYLEQANQTDRMIAELWHWVQTTTGYKDNTTFLITTDHGRGSKSSKWTSHNTLVGGSSQTWLAMMGPSITPLGEIKSDQQLYQEQIAQTIAMLVGEKFDPGKNIAKAISIR